ncbi:globin [Teredinibacter purpureus]|uniref:globin n=1 Tax=Teredinibacter purpureus TaxID=2731756 RepID=UPI0005F7A808|nr:globin [Teredinibacter purpureus]
MNVVAQFNDSFERNVSNHFELFFRTFYNHFEALSPQISAVFAHTVESRRHEMLEDSILMLMSCSAGKEASVELKHLASFHARQGIDVRMYDDWFEALMQTLTELDDTFCDADRHAWQEMLLPGIRYMKDYHE